MKLFKILIFGALALTAGAMAYAQETCPLPIMVQVDNSDNSISEANEKLLTSKLKQLVASKGFGSDAELSHLCLKASVSETGDKQVISGMRPVVAGSLDVYLVLTNLLSGETFGADNITVKGAGNNEQRMVQAALARINPTNPALQKFIQNARVKVFDYYRSHIPSIISQANAASRGGKYDTALYLLSTVPPCVEGYDDVASAMLRVYQDYLEVDCNEKLSAARAIWASTQTEEGASAAAAYLAAIDSRATCYEEARELLKEISGRVDENLRRVIAREDEDRAFEKELIRGEAELERTREDNDFTIQKMKIDAIRQIGMAYAEAVIGTKANDKPQQAASAESEGSDSKKKSPIIIINN